MNTATDLSAWLLERLAKDEAVALAVPEVERKSSARIFTSLHEPTGTVEVDPARVLANVAALREVIALHESCDDVSFGDQSTCPTLRALAQSYAGAEGWRDDWA